MNFDTFWPDLLGMLVSGILLALLFFWAREKWFPVPDIDGRWFFTTVTTQTDYNPYRDMELVFDVMLWREGTLIKGTTEKIYERSSKGEVNYVGNLRTRGEINGWVEKRYFGTDRVFLHIVEKGRKRESTVFYTLEVQNSKKMTGSFASMAANQKGEANCRRSWERPS